MKVLKYLVSVWAAIAVYSALSLFYGATGFSAYRELLSGREIQWENIKKLALVNSELENTQNSLLYDRDTVAVHARQLGYGYDEERFIRIVGLGGLKKPSVTVGEIVVTPEPVFLSDRNIKLCALFVGIMVFGLLFSVEFFRS
jgi:cell division protein FtsB